MAVAVECFFRGFHQDKDEMISEISQMEKDKSCMILLFYGIFKGNKKSLEIGSEMVANEEG